MDREKQIRSKQAHKQTKLREVSWKEIMENYLPSINLSTSQKFDNEHTIHQWKLHCIYTHTHTQFRWISFLQSNLFMWVSFFLTGAFHNWSQSHYGHGHTPSRVWCGTVWPLSTKTEQPAAVSTTSLTMEVGAVIHVIHWIGRQSDHKCHPPQIQWACHRKWKVEWEAPEIRKCVNEERRWAWTVSLIPYPTLPPSLINRMVSVDVKHHNRRREKKEDGKRTLACVNVQHTPSKTPAGGLPWTCRSKGKRPSRQTDGQSYHHKWLTSWMI